MSGDVRPKERDREQPGPSSEKTAGSHSKGGERKERCSSRSNLEEGMIGEDLKLSSGGTHSSS